MTEPSNDTVTVEVAADGALVVHGDIDMAGGPVLEAALLAHETTDPLIIDLGDVFFIDSSGLRSLLGASRRAHDRGTTVSLRSVGPEVARLLEITGTTSQFHIESTRRSLMTEIQTPPRTMGPVHLRVPAEPSLSRVLRLAASGLASLTDFDVDEIEDIKIAVSEVLIALIEHGELQSVEIEFSVDQTGFVVRGRTAVSEFNVDHPDLVLCRTVLAGVCAEHAIDHVDGHAEIRAVVLRGS